MGMGGGVSGIADCCAAATLAFFAGIGSVLRRGSKWGCAVERRHAILVLQRARTALRGRRALGSHGAAERNVGRSVWPDPPPPWTATEPPKG
eukprot:2914519-Prymnesium_polylepis.1